jgi:hypothetical protein
MSQHPRNQVSAGLERPSGHTTVWLTMTAVFVDTVAVDCAPVSPSLKSASGYSRASWATLTKV